MLFVVFDGEQTCEGGDRMGQKMRSRVRWAKILLLAGTLSVGSGALAARAFTFLQRERSAQTEDVTTIVVDAGHGGYDSGSISACGILEKDVTLTLALLVGSRLEEAGYAVVYTRTSDVVEWPSDNTADLAARVATAIEADADVYLSIHLNASAYDDGACGFEAYADPDDVRTWAMAAAVLEQLTALGFSENRGVKDAWDSQLYVICQNPIPALLVELGFITDSQDIDYILAHPQQLADAIAQGLIDTLNET